MYLKNLLRSSPIFLMMLVYGLITKVTNFSNTVYWMVFALCLIIGWGVSKLIAKTLLK